MMKLEQQSEEERDSAVSKMKRASSRQGTDSDRWPHTQAFFRFAYRLSSLLFLLGVVGKVLSKMLFRSAVVLALSLLASIDVTSAQSDNETGVKK